MKVICDVCGTTFADTATHCPICGCAAVRPAKTVAEADVQTSSESGTAGAYARGGRFAKSNVRRNTRAKEGRFSDDRNRKNDSQQGNKGLIAVVIVLLLAIVMVVVYIGVNVFLKDLGALDNGGNNQGSSAYQDGDGNQVGEEIPCTDFDALTFVKLETENEQILLNVVFTPENTTDEVTFTSADPEIATVGANGLVKPGTKQGETVITITCGSVTKECRVESTVGEAPEPPEPEIPEVVLPEGFVLKLETYKGSGEITISKEGGSHQLYKELMGVKASDITWTTSDPAVATVENGKVVGVDRGNCTITATIGDQTATCFVRCPFDAAAPTPYELNTKDVTLYAGGGSDSFTSLELKEIATGAKMQVEWKADKEGAVEISDTGKVTACNVTSSVTVKVSTEYEGVTYTCIVRVHPKKTEN